MFRTVPVSIIRNVSLYTQQWYMLYRFCWQLANRIRTAVLILLASCQQTCNNIYRCCVYSEKLLRDTKQNPLQIPSAHLWHRYEPPLQYCDTSRCNILKSSHLNPVMRAARAHATNQLFMSVQNRITQL